MRRKSKYDKFPIIPVDPTGEDCWENLPEAHDRLGLSRLESIP
jgi:hypothetical protein